MSDWLQYLPLILVAAGLISTFATLRYKIVQNCNAVKELRKDLKDLRNVLDSKLSEEEHRMICTPIQQQILSRLDAMDKERARAREIRDKQIKELSDSLNFIKGQLSQLLNREK